MMTHRHHITVQVGSALQQQLFHLLFLVAVKEEGGFSKVQSADDRAVVLAVNLFGDWTQHRQHCTAAKVERIPCAQQRQVQVFLLDDIQQVLIGWWLESACPADNRRRLHR